MSLCGGRWGRSWKTCIRKSGGEWIWNHGPLSGGTHPSRSSTPLTETRRLQGAIRSTGTRDRSDLFIGRHSPEYGGKVAPKVERASVGFDFLGPEASSSTDI